MISYSSALQKVLEHTLTMESQEVDLFQSNGQVLAENIYADRDFPPFDRATKDGIAIAFDAVERGNKKFKSAGIAQAGSPQQNLQNSSDCIEIMTGAMVPRNADTVVMYEHLMEKDGVFELQKEVQQGQNIHYQASDVAKGSILLWPGTRIGSAEIGVMATVGKSRVLIKKLPKIAVISTGNELVDVDKTPEPFQIRKSNSHTIHALLQNEGITAELFHFVDDLQELKSKLETIVQQFDVLLLSGGVSKGKFDFLPAAFDALGVKKVFHKVKLRPGKPFWFGVHKASETTIFSFPGNPVSTFVGYHVYFRTWLNKSLGVDSPEFTVFLKESFENTTDLTLFVAVELENTEGKLMASRISTTGSGDVKLLSRADGFICVNPGEVFTKNQIVRFIPSRKVVT
nr:molybdopterin molybdotransferase MoeA [Allomuricauda sp.]